MGTPLACILLYRNPTVKDILFIVLHFVLILANTIIRLGSVLIEFVVVVVNLCHLSRLFAQASWHTCDELIFWYPTNSDIFSLNNLCSPLHPVGFISFSPNNKILQPMKNEQEVHGEQVTTA